MAILNERLWRNAYMIEFLKNGVPEKCFTFSVPPESETIESPQRVTETKTFGGSVFDEYGPDSVKINLSGSTINNERKLIYRGNRQLPAYYTGEKEIFELQRLFDEWGQLDNIPDKKVYIYDLSKMTLPQIGLGSPAKNYWRIIEKNFKIRRTKDRPLAFSYDLEVIGVADKGHKPEAVFSDDIVKILDKCQATVEAVQNALEITEAVADSIDSFMNGFMAVRNTFDDIGNARGIEIVDVIFGRPLRIITGGSNRSVYNTCKSFMAAGSKIQSLYEDPESGFRGNANYSRDDEFIVSFNSGPGSYTAPARVSYGETAARPPDPVLQKYKFGGWFKDDGFQNPFDFSTEEITKNITLYAKWGQVQATVTFNSRQGTAVQPETVNIGGKAAVPPPPSRSGYEFEYWCTDITAALAFDFSVSISGDLTLYARWRTVYTAVFDSGGGSFVENQTVNAGGLVIYPLTPVRENYLFAMWCSGAGLAEEYDFNSSVNGNITLYAKWTRVSNDVKFISNGGSEVPGQTVPIGGHAVNPGAPAREGYQFLRWCTDEGLTQEFLFDSAPVNYPVTLYARWRINVYVVSFESNGGTAVEPQEVSHGGFAVYPPIPAKENNLFKQWCGNAGLTTEFNFSAPVTENMTLYAAWWVQ
jgi:uncharacterized repeat protein (TIGR02543 family)